MANWRVTDPKTGEKFIMQSDSEPSDSAVERYLSGGSTVGGKDVETKTYSVNAERRPLSTWETLFPEAVIASAIKNREATYPDTELWAAPAKKKHFWEMSDEEEGLKSKMAQAINIRTGIPEEEAFKKQGDVLRRPGVTEAPLDPRPKDVAEAIMKLALVYGAGANPLATIKGLATFGGINEMENAVSSMIQHKPVKLGGGETAADLLPKTTSGGVRGVADVLDFLIKGAAATKASGLIDKGYKKLTTPTFKDDMAGATQMEMDFGAPIDTGKPGEPIGRMLPPGAMYTPPPAKPAGLLPAPGSITTYPKYGGQPSGAPIKKGFEYGKGKLDVFGKPVVEPENTYLPNAVETGGEVQRDLFPSGQLNPPVGEQPISMETCGGKALPAGIISKGSKVEFEPGMQSPTKRQLAFVHFLRDKYGVSKDSYKDMCRDISGGRTDTAVDLTSAEISQFIERLSGGEIPAFVKRGEHVVPPGRDFVAGERFFSAQNAIANVWWIMRSAYKGYNRAASIKMEAFKQGYSDFKVTPERDCYVAMAADGTYPVSELQVNERAALGYIKDFFNQYADRFQLSKDMKISEYFPHIWFRDKGGLWKKWSTANNFSDYQKELVAKFLAGDITTKETHKIDKQGWLAISEIRGAIEMTEEMGNLTPKEVFFANLKPRKAMAKGYILNVSKTVQAYVYGAERKLWLDKAIRDVLPILVALPDGKRVYAAKYINQVVGVRTVAERNYWNNINRWVSEDKPFAKYIQKVNPDKLSRMASTYYYARMIGGALDTAVANLTQGMLTATDIGVKNWTIGALKLMTKQGKKTVHDTRVLMEYESYLREHIMHLSGKTLGSKILNGSLDLLFTPMQWAEYINRGASFLGSMEYYKRGGQMPTKATELAWNFSDKSAVSFAEIMMLHNQWEYGRLGSSPYLFNPAWKFWGVFTSYYMKLGEFAITTVAGPEHAAFSTRARRITTLLAGLGMVAHFTRNQLMPQGLMVATEIAQDAGDIANIAMGKPGALDKMMMRYKKTFPIRYAAKMAKVIERWDNGWVVEDDQGQLLYHTTPLQQVAWLLGLKTAEDRARGDLNTDIRDEGLNRREAYSYAYRLIARGQVQQAKHIMEKWHLDTKTVMKEVARKKRYPKALRKIKNMPPWLEAQYLQRYMDVNTEE